MWAMVGIHAHERSRGHYEQIHFVATLAGVTSKDLDQYDR